MRCGKIDVSVGYGRDGDGRHPVSAGGSGTGGVVRGGWVAAARVGGWWGEQGSVGFAGGEGCLHCVVDFDDGALGAVFAVLLFVLAADDGEVVQDVGDGVPRGGEVVLEIRELLGRFIVGAAVGAACRAPVAVVLGRQVEVEEGGVQLAAEEEAALLVPSKRWAVPAAFRCEGFEIPGGVRQLKRARRQPVSKCFVGVPRRRAVEHLRWQDGDLLGDEETKVGSSQLESCHEVTNKTRQKCWQGSRGANGRRPYRLRMSDG